MDIILAQYADTMLTLVFVQYDDDNTEILPKTHPSLVSYTRGGGVIQPYAPLMPGGIVPAGTIGWFCAETPPSGYLVCDGSELSRARYYRLFSVIGTTFGEGDGQTTFNLPDLGGRCIRAWAQGSTLDPNRAFGTAQGDSPKEHSHELLPITHTHTITDPGHLHGVNDPGHIHPITDPGHFHSIVDPGHTHIFSRITHMGYDAQFVIYAGGSIRMKPFDFFTAYYYQPTRSNFINASVQSAPANLQLANAKSNVSAGSAFTNVSINEAGTNIPYTEYEGGDETRPENIALLPMIRY